ncbi:MAG: hypothetical protein A2289_14005 [Deltaproteobacteria bacterium RIFOXYA12_FULL_58_15]|nr:MAG: hypothetical protein A2289_14005 [Deltaproteobacteria bacterium RIFOXYA12_FULL_58_15]OGR09635.1 MAG: hypothetical protein A2341_00270 [Deltaproteobacteria bacterium RIFOXYB12_FULL_58_9]
MYRLIVVIPFILAGLGCDGQDVSGCVADTECDAGYVCEEHKCEQICQTDPDCAPGFNCGPKNLCVEGERTSGPKITNVVGSSSQICPDTDPPNSPCIGDHFIVSGSGLARSAFTLTRTDGTAGGPYALEVAAGGRDLDGVVDLAITTPLNTPAGQPAAGYFTLSVVNSAGEDQANLFVLQGVQGPKGEDGASMTAESIVTAINASAFIIDADNVDIDVPVPTGNDLIASINTGTDQILADRVVGGGSGGSAGTTYYYNNSATPTELDVNSDRMVVRVNAGTTVQSLAVDNARLLSLCADPDGCAISLAVVNWSFAGELIAAPWDGMPCRFFIEEDGGVSGSNAWAVSAACGNWYAIWKDANMDGVPDAWSTPPGFFAPYRSGFFSNDGYSGDSWEVLNNNFACFFSESAPTGATGGFASDTAKGFYVVAAGPDWLDSWAANDLDTNWPTTQDGRACVLVVED